MKSNRIRKTEHIEASTVIQSESPVASIDASVRTQANSWPSQDHVHFPADGFTSEDAWPDKRVLVHMAKALYVRHEEILNRVLPLYPKSRRAGLMGALLVAQEVTFRPGAGEGIVPDEIELSLPSMDKLAGPQSIRDLLVGISSALYCAKQDRVQDVLVSLFIEGNDDAEEALFWADLLCLAESVLHREGILTDLDGQALDFETPVRELRNMTLVPAMAQCLAARNEGIDNALTSSQAA